MRKKKQIKQNVRWLSTPIPANGERLEWSELMEWTAWTGFVEGYVAARISDLDRRFLDDYIQECWLQLLSVPHDKILDIYYSGKGKYTNFIKSLINNNIHSTVSPLYKNLRRDSRLDTFLDDTGWSLLANNEVSYSDLPISKYSNQSEKQVSITADKSDIQINPTYENL